MMSVCVKGNLLRLDTYVESSRLYHKIGTDYNAKFGALEDPV